MAQHEDNLHQDNLHHRFDTEESVDQLVDRGRLLMLALTNKVQAAKLEAERAELQLALDDARSGRPYRLRQLVSAFETGSWLDPQQTTDGHNEVRGHSPKSALATHDRTFDSKITINVPNDPANPWETLLQHSRTRLEEWKNANTLNLRNANLTLTQKNEIDSNPTDCHVQTAKQSSPPQPTKADKQSKSQKRSEPASRAHSARTPHAGSIAIPNSAGRSKAIRRTTATRKIAKESQDPAVVEIAKSFCNPTRNPRETSRVRSFTQRAGGLSLSAVVHVLIVICLAIYHLKAPETNPGMAFESSIVDNQPESIEVSQSADVAEPESEPTSEPMSAESKNIEQTLLEAGDLAANSVLSAPQISSTSFLTDASNASQSAASIFSKANASFFGVASGGNNFCYVVDTSGSMRGQPWEAAKRELLRSLASLNEKQRFYIIFVGKEFEAIPAAGEREPSQYMLYATRDNLEHARRWIERTKIGSGSPPTDALEFAISKEPDAIYLLTDGVTKVDVCGFLQKVNRTEDLINGERVRVPIHAIAFFSLAGQDLMRRIAAENRGQFIYVPNPRQK